MKLLPRVVRLILLYLQDVNSIILSYLTFYAKLGTAHPPGYPLITLIIYGITLLRDVSLQFFPNITVASCVNAFCAICTTLAAFLIGRKDAISFST